MSDEVLFQTSHDMILMARRNMVQDAWDYVCGAAESETSLRRNRMAIDSLALRPRVCRDVSEIDTSIEFQGTKMRIPVFLAPMGSIQNFSPNGALDVDTAAEEFGVMNFVSTVTQPSLEEIGANTPHGKNFQIYVRGDDDWIKELLKRVKASNYSHVTLTVDSAFYGNRERLNPSQIALRRVPARDWQKKITWDTVKMVQDEIDGRPFSIKGIQTGEDADIAAGMGVDAVYVSNHGGRQLDHVLGNMAMLPEIVDAVNGRCDVIIDGGFTRGTDIVKALALGAKAVGIGRLQAWALGAGGAQGLIQCLGLLEREIETAMGLIGVTAIDQIDKSYVTEAPWVRLPHEHSAFPHVHGPLA